MKVVCGSPHMETRGDINPKEKKIWFRDSVIFGIVPNKYKWISFTSKVGIRKSQTGKQDLET